MTERKVQHIVSLSGGKDSSACYALAVQRLGGNFRAVFCDTGHEHPETYEYVSRIHEHIGGPKAEVVRADFAKRIMKKRQTVETKWADDGVPQEWVDRALELLHPTGNPFLDLAMLKGRFPSTMARFCTEELKVWPIVSQILLPALKQGPVLQWVGVRRDESQARSDARMFEKADPGGRYFRPLIHWTADDVISFLKTSGMEINPLYSKGFSRVGCFPCIMARKDEIRNIALRYPEEIIRVKEWEILVSAVAKRGQSTFFGNGKVPNVENANIDQVVEWSKTKRGGKVIDPEVLKPIKVCSSVYGLCE